MLSAGRYVRGTQEWWAALFGRSMSRRAGLRAGALGLVGLLAAVGSACDGGGGGDEEEEEDD